MLSVYKVVDVKTPNVLGANLCTLLRRTCKHLHRGMSQPAFPWLSLSFLLLSLGCSLSSVHILITQTVLLCGRLLLLISFSCCCRGTASCEIRTAHACSRGGWGGGERKKVTYNNVKGERLAGEEIKRDRHMSLGCFCSLAALIGVSEHPGDQKETGCITSRS